MNLPKDYPAFDYATISDEILPIHYTAWQGVELPKVQASVDDLFQQANQGNLALLVSLRHDFPTEWSAFVNGTGDLSADDPQVEMWDLAGKDVDDQIGK